MNRSEPFCAFGSVTVSVFLGFPSNGNSFSLDHCATVKNSGDVSCLLTGKLRWLFIMANVVAFVGEPGKWLS